MFSLRFSLSRSRRASDRVANRFRMNRQTFPMNYSLYGRIGELSALGSMCDGFCVRVHGVSVFDRVK